MDGKTEGQMDGGGDSCEWGGCFDGEQELCTPAPSPRGYLALPTAPASCLPESELREASGVGWPCGTAPPPPTSLTLGGGWRHLFLSSGPCFCVHTLRAVPSAQRALRIWVEGVNNSALTPRGWAPPEKPGSGTSGDPSQPDTWGLSPASAVQWKQDAGSHTGSPIQESKGSSSYILKCEKKWVTLILVSI